MQIAVQAIGRDLDIKLIGAHDKNRCTHSGLNLTAEVENGAEGRGHHHEVLLARWALLLLGIGQLVAPPPGLLASLDQLVAPQLRPPGSSGNLTRASPRCSPGLYLHSATLALGKSTRILARRSELRLLVK